VVAGTTSANCNLGVVTVDSGATLFETGTVQSSDLTILSGGTLDMNNQLYSFIGTTFTNNGAVISSSGGNGEFDFNGVGTAIGTTQNLAGTGTYNTNGRVDFHSRQSGLVVPASGTVLNGLTNWNIDGGSTISVSNDFVVNGLTGAGAATTFNNGGAISGTAIMKTHNNVAIDGCGGMSAPVEVVAGTTSANCNLGVVTVDSGATLFETGTVNSNDLTILSGGTVDMNNQFYSFIGTTFTNNGAVISSGGFGEFDFNGVGNAIGTTQNLAGMGTYNTNGQINFHCRQSTNAVIGISALVEGVFNHNIDGGSTLTNNGTMAPGFPPGQANVGGNWQLGSTSNLDFDIGGTISGTNYEVFNKTDGGALTLHGNLVVHLINNFTPQNSDTFTIVTTQAILQGAFSNVANGGRLTTADGGGSFQVTYNVLNNPVASRNVMLSNFLPSGGIVATPVIHPPSGPVIKKESIAITCATAGEIGRASCRERE